MVGPNPAVKERFLRIQLVVTVDADVSIRFFNKLGKEIGKTQAQVQGGVQENEIPWDISNYAAGVYYCVITVKSAFGEKSITKRFAVVN
jgi:hypothetical protein